MVMYSWNRSDLWAEADARIARRAVLWKSIVLLSVLSAWLALTVLRSYWDLVSLVDVFVHWPS